MLDKWIKEISDKESLFIKKNGKKYQIILRLLSSSESEETEDHLIAEGDKNYCVNTFKYLSNLVGLINIVDY